MTLAPPLASALPHAARERGAARTGEEIKREKLVFIGTCSVTTALVSAFTKKRQSWCARLQIT